MLQSFKIPNRHRNAFGSGHRLSSGLTPDSGFDLGVDGHEQVTHTVSDDPCGVQEGLQVQGIPAQRLVLPRNVDLNSPVPHSSGDLPMNGVHSQEQSE